MIELGRIAIFNQSAITTGRKKIYTLVEELTGDKIVATRIAAAVSAMCRSLYTGLEDMQMEIALDTDSLTPTLYMTCGYHFQPLPQKNVFVPFFDDVRHLQLDKGHAIQVASRLTVKRAPAPGMVERIRLAINRKSHDELMEEIQHKNLELEESLENLKRTTTANKRMESELNVGHEIQMSMLPLVFPPYPERSDISVFAKLQPAREVGGDFYDFFFIDDDRLCFCIGDVSGKGVPSALFMAVSKTMMKSKSTQGLSPGVMLSRVNDDLFLDNVSCMFVTIFAGILDTRTGEMTYTNAGHNPPYIRRSNGEIERVDELHGPVVAAVEDIKYSEGHLVLAPDDLLLMYTDGVTEAMDIDQTLFDEERLVRVMSDEPCDSVEEAVNSTLSAVMEFQGDAEQADDITLLALKFQGRETSGSSILELSIGNQLTEIDRVNQAFDEFAEENGIPMPISLKVNMAFDELLNNTISYAFEKGAHQIDIKVERADAHLTITVSDSGKSFNPFETEAPDTELSIEEREIGGLGIHLVRNIMDEFSYQRHDERNIITLVMNLDSGNNS
ncbi:MAG: sigma-B regulation protein RsbU (phosphoserine phosphatase) [Candidatus Latescibacterota bacterium]|jgi:sigma-B regulation protein RsbU (phosphoserine phosphatase)